MSKMKKSSTYGKNLRRSAGRMASQIAYTAMPSLSQTIVSTRTAVSDIKQFALKGRSQLNIQNKYSKRTLLRPISEIIENAKEDLKSGKFYNEERINETRSSAMSDFLGTMSGEEDSYYEENDNSSMNSLNKFISTTSANSMSSARAISDTQIKTAEYLGELSITQHNQTLVFSRQQHLESMNKLDNLEKIGMSLAEFNTKTMSDHIRATNQFYNDILSEAREIKKSIDNIASNINSRYGTGQSKKYKKNDLADIFSGGSFDISNYLSYVKNNANNMIPFNMDMMKGIFNDFKASPISGLMNLAGSFMMPKGAKKGVGKLDKTIQGLFGQYLNTVDQWKHGKNLSKNEFISIIQEAIGNVAGVDLTTKINPDLSSYKNEKITLELEQKKAKAITEVIPSYLSQILKAVSHDGKEMYFNYTSGRFEDMKEAKKKEDKNFRNSIKYSSDVTSEYFTIASNKIDFGNKEINKAFKEDTETFLIYMITNAELGSDSTKFIGSGAFYKDLVQRGLFFNLGEVSAKMLGNMWLSASPSKRKEMIGDLMNSRALARDISNRRDSDLLSSGKTALYNGLSKLDKDKKIIRLDAKTQREMYAKSVMNFGNVSEDDIRSYISMKKEDLDIEDKKQFISKESEEKIAKKLEKLGFKKPKSKIDNIYKSIKRKFSNLSDKLEDELSNLSDIIAEKTENSGPFKFNNDIVTYDEDNEEYTNFPISSTKVKVKRPSTINNVNNRVSKKRVSTTKNIRTKINNIAKKTIYNINPSGGSFVGGGNQPPIMTSSIPQSIMVSNIIDYRPYFETLDSHLRNIATIISQDKAMHITGNPTTGSMTGIMSGASDKLKGLYSKGRETISDTLTSLKNTLSNTSTKIKSFVVSASNKAKEGKSKFGGVLNKAKESGLDFLSKIAKGISETGGNITEYFKSDSFKELLGGAKSRLETALRTGKEFAGTLFDKLKSGGGALLKKGKGMAIGGAISSMLGLGPIPGAIIGTLFSKNKKKKDTSSEEDKQMDEIEKQEKSGGGFLDKFKAKKKKSVLLGAGISSMLGLGPIPGALLTMIFNKRLVKKSGEEKDEEKQAEDIAEGVDKAEKQSKGIGKGKKLKNLTMGAMASSVLGLGPMPGVIAASIYNKYKDKAAKKKDREENKQAEEATEAMEEATSDKKKKGGFLSKIKNFFGKGKNLAIGATASTLLGLGPMPGIIAASIYNKNKYKKNKDNEETLDNTIENTKDKVLSKTAESPEAKEQRKKNKEYIEHVKQARDAEASGNIDKADKMEKSLLNKAKSDGDINTARAAQGFIADSKNSSGGSGKVIEKEKKSKGLFSILGDFLGGGIGGLLGTIASVAAPLLVGLLGGKLINWLKENGAGGHDTTNEQGDANFANWSDNIKGGINAVTTKMTGKALSKLGLGKLGAGAAMGMKSSFESAAYHANEGKAYSDRYAGTLAQEEYGRSVKDTTKGVWYGAKTLKAAKNTKLGKATISGAKKLLTDKVVTKGGAKVIKGADGVWRNAKTGRKFSEKFIKSAVEDGVAKPTLITRFKNAITSFFKNEKVVKFAGKFKMTKLLDKAKGFVAKNADNIIGKVLKGAGTAIGRLTTKLASFASVVLAWLPLITAVTAFINGWNNAARDRGIDETFPGFWKARMANAIAYAIDDLLCGIPDMIGLKDWFASMLTELFMSDEEEANLKKSQKAQLDEYEQFLKDNDLNREGFTQDMYNKMKHKSIWGHVKSAFGAGDDLSKYKSGGKSNAALKEKYGGYVAPTQNIFNIDNSETVNAVVGGDSGGSGGRGSLSDKSTSQIVKYARDKLSKNMYSNNATKLNDDDINKYMKSSQFNNDNDDSNSKKKGFFSKLGSTITNAAKWVGNKLTTGWDWLKSTVGGWFGSGGRGNSTNNTTNNYTYYSQKDPKWANQSFGKYNGKRDTVKEGGCGPAVAAMALEQLTGKQVLPSTMADLALKAGHKYDNGGTDPSFFNTAGSLYGVGFKQTPGFNKATVESLKAGNPVPLLGKNGPYGSGSHYILATDIDNSGNVSILDPQNKNNNKKYNVKSLQQTTNSSMVSTIRKCTANNKYVNKVRSVGRGNPIPRFMSGRGLTIQNTPAINPGYKEANRGKNDIKYIVIHYAANNDGKAAGAKNWYNGREASAHFAVGSDGIYQTLDVKHIAYHCGGGKQSNYGATFYGKCTNSNSIGIEMASHKDNKGKYSIDETTVNNAILLTNKLMSDYGIPKDNVIRHYDVTGKLCPAPWVPNGGDESKWIDFKNRLSGVSRSLTVGEAIVSGMAALENKLNYSQSSRNPENGSGDCSSTVQWVYKKVCGVDPGPNTSSMADNGTLILKETKNVDEIIKNAKAGDLLLWKGHVEVYDGDGGCWGHGGGSKGTTPGTRHSTVSGFMSSRSGGCQVRRYISGNESINTNLGTITDKDGNTVDIVISSALSSSNMSSTDNSGQTIVQSFLNNAFKINENSEYAKIMSASLLKTIGGTTRTGTITLPSGLGKNSTYMGWQKITSKSSNQYKLREEAGMNFDSNGMGIIDGRYVVATTPKFGSVGDYITVKTSDGSSFGAIIGDIKGADAGNEWGHNNGGSVVEAVVDQTSWYNKKNNTAIPWYGKEITSITNEGNYWGRGNGSNTSILPYKVKSNIASMKPNIPDRMIGRGGDISTEGILNMSKNALNNKNNIKINKSLSSSNIKNTDVNISNNRKNTSSNSIQTNNKDDLMIIALQNIVSLLTDIRTSNKTISEKNFSPVIGVKSNSNGNYGSNSQKSALIDNIIAGI